MKRVFDHEKLKAYEDSIRFVVWASELLERVPRGLAVSDQLNRASASIPLNIAEGNGRHTSADRCRFFDTARGSAFECAACLDVVVARQILADTDLVIGKELLRGIVSMLVGLIRGNSSDRLHEDHIEYRADGENKFGPGLNHNPNGDDNRRLIVIPTKIFFDHERLRVYQASLKFIESLNVISKKGAKKLTIWPNLDRASTSIPLNIAEGNGKSTANDRCRFFDNSRGAALHCAAGVDILVAKGNLDNSEASACKEALHDIVSMLIGLIKSNSSDRLHETGVNYRIDGVRKKKGD